MSFSFNIFPIYCINLLWLNTIIQDLGICFYRGISLSSEMALLCSRRIFRCSFYPYLYFAVWTTWRKGLNISWPSTDPGTETGRHCCLCSFPNKHSHIPLAAPHRREAGKLRESPWDVDIHQTLKMSQLPVSVQPTERWSLVPVLETGFLPPGNSAHINEFLCEWQPDWECHHS